MRRKLRRAVGFAKANLSRSSGAKYSGRLVGFGRGVDKRRWKLVRQFQQARIMLNGRSVQINYPFRVGRGEAYSKHCSYPQLPLN